MSLLNNIKMKPKLIGLFLVVGLLPLIIATIFGIWRASDALLVQTFEKLDAVGKIKEDRIESYFSEREGDMSVLANTVKALREEGFDVLEGVHMAKKTRLEEYFATMRANLLNLKDDPYVRQAMLDFDRAFEDAGDSVDTPAWRALAEQYDPRLQDIAQDNGWHDFFLIHHDGDIVYTIQREDDLGMVIPDSSLAETGLGAAFQEAHTLVADEVAVSDFAPYSPSGGAMEAFMMAPMRNMTGTLVGYVAFELPKDRVNSIVQDRTSLGTTGETYIVGQEDGVSAYRSDRVVKTGKIGDPRGGTYVERALAGEAGSDIKVGSTGDLELTVYTPLDIAGLDWALFTTMALREVVVPTVEGAEQDYFTSYIEQYGYYDLFLIDERGYVFYSVKQEADYETNLLDGEYSNSNLGRLLQDVLETQSFGIADFAPYAPSDNAYAAFIAQPVLTNGQTELVVALQLPHEHINAIMSENTGMGDTGESYLVGRANGVTSFRSDLTTMSDAYVIGYEISTPYIDAALAGNTAEAEDLTEATDTAGNTVLVVYEPLEIQGLNWAIVSKVLKSEMMQPAYELRNILIVLAVVIAAAVSVVGVFFATSLANPILLMAKGAQRLAVGDAELADMDWDRIERVNARGDELGMVGRAFSDLITYFKRGASAMQRIAHGDLSVEIEPEGETDLMGNAMVTMKRRIAALTEAVNELIDAAVAGRLDTRADPSRFEGEYRRIVQGINETLDAVIGPLNVAAEYVDRISKGDIPEPITDEYRGDFNEIKLNLNLCIEALNGLLSETQRLTVAAVEGQLDARGDPGQFNGAYADLVQGFNNTLDAVIGPLNVAAEYVDRISKGDIPEPITDEYRGDFNEIKLNLNLCIENLTTFTSRMRRMYREHVAGDYEVQISTDQFIGIYREMADGVNQAVGIHVRNILTILDIVAAYAEGDFSPVLEQLPGKQAVANERMDLLRENLRALVREVTSLTDAAAQGQLSTRADVERFQGDWARLVAGMNHLLDAVIEPLNVAAEYVDQIAGGEIPEPITEEYQGDFARFRDNLNALSANLRQMLSNMQEASTNLSSAAAQILAATQQQASGASEQSASITQTTTTVDEVRSISEQAIVRAEEVSESSQRTVEVSRAGRGAVEITIDSMAQIKERVEGIAENILALSDKTQQIGEITATVNDIASQSNMLALNASVEAARAGEHGKGFAVVAAEVRSLAEQSKQATAQVRSILTDIQNAITASVMVTEEGAKAVDQGVDQAAQAREAIEQLSSVITESAQIAAQVAAGGQQQASGVEQIALAIENINQAMQQNLASTRQAEKAAQDLNSLATSLDTTVRQYKLNGGGNGHK
jgi:methyl-accepting chemotaxis protein